MNHNNIKSRQEIRDTVLQYMTAPFKHLKTINNNNNINNNNIYIEKAVIEGYPVAAYRLITDINCSLEAFRSILSTTDHYYIYDTNIAHVETVGLDTATGIDGRLMRSKNISAVSKAREYCTCHIIDTIYPNNNNNINNKEGAGDTYNDKGDGVVYPEALEKAIRSLLLVGYSSNANNNNNNKRSDKHHSDVKTYETDKYIPPYVLVDAGVNSEHCPENNNNNNNNNEKIIRANVFALGYLAFPIFDNNNNNNNNNKIRVARLSFVDPKGNIPEFALDNANADTYKVIMQMGVFASVIDSVARTTRTPLRAPYNDFFGATDINNININNIISAEGKDKDMNNVKGISLIEKKYNVNDKCQGVSMVVREKTAVEVLGITAGNGQVYHNDSKDYDDDESDEFKSVEEGDDIWSELLLYDNLHNNNNNNSVNNKNERKEPRRSEIDSICGRLISLYNFKGWEHIGTFDECSVETVVTPLSQYKAIRISTNIRCFIDEFYKIVTDQNVMSKIEPDDDNFSNQLVVNTPYGPINVSRSSHSSHSGNLNILPREFVTVTGAKYLTQTERSEAKLYNINIDAKVLVVNTMDYIASDGKEVVPESNGYIRGSVIAQGFIAVAIPSMANRITVFYTSLVDQKGGKCPDEMNVKLGLQIEIKRMMGVSNAVKLLCKEAHSNPKRGGELQSIMRDWLATSAAPPAINEMKVLELFLASHSNPLWSTSVNNVMGCVVDTLPLSYTTANKYVPKSKTPVENQLLIIRATKEINCTLSKFIKIASKNDFRLEYDTEIKVMKPTNSGPPNAKTFYIGYRSQKSSAAAGGLVLPHSGAGFCEMSVSKKLNESEVKRAGITTVLANAYVIGGVNFQADSKNMEECLKGYTIGRVHINGIMALAIPPTATRIRLSHQWCVEFPSHTGWKLRSSSYPCNVNTKEKKKIEKIQAEIARRVTAIADICDNYHSNNSNNGETISDCEYPSTTSSMPSFEYDSLENSDEEDDIPLNHPGSITPIDGNTNSNINSPTTINKHNSELYNKASQSETTKLAADIDVEGHTTTERSVKEEVSSGDVILLANPVFRTALDLHLADDWTPAAKQTQECLLSFKTVPYSRFRAIRIETEVNCSLVDFKKFMEDGAILREYDQNLKDIECVAKIPPGVDILYTSYKRESRFIAPRDFLFRTAKILLTSKEALQHLLISPADANEMTVEGLNEEETTILKKGNINGDPSILYFTAARTFDEDEKHKGPMDGWVRGVLFCYSNIAVATSNPRKIKFINYSCTDPNGNIPKALIDAATSLSVDKIAKIRYLLENK